MPRAAKIRKNPRGEKLPDARERGACLMPRIIYLCERQVHLPFT